MPTQEHQPSGETPVTPETTEQSTGAEEEQRYKTLAIRLDESQHTQLRFIAQLSGISVTEEIRRAIAQRITTAQEDPDLIARAQHARDQIEKEAAARSAAIAGFIGQQAVATPPSRGRGRNK